MVKETVLQIAGTSITTTAKVFTAAGVSIITRQNALAEKNGACMYMFTGNKRRAPRHDIISLMCSFQLCLVFLNCLLISTNILGTLGGTVWWRLEKFQHLVDWL